MSNEDFIFASIFFHPLTANNNAIMPKIIEGIIELSSNITKAIKIQRKASFLTRKTPPSVVRQLAELLGRWDEARKSSLKIRQKRVFPEDGFFPDP